MAILSIDWDYFMDCTDSERVMLFPDGGNEGIGLSLSTMVWSSRYEESKLRKHIGDTRKGLLDIGAREEDLERVKNFITNAIGIGTKVVFADSHKEIYDVIKEYADDYWTNQFDIINLDHHSDCYNIGDELNCGNWVNKLDEECYINRYIFVSDDRNEVLTEDILENAKVINATIDILDELEEQEEEIELIFICRSSIWSLPHLDVRFNTFYDFFKDLGYLFNEAFFTNRFNVIERRLQYFNVEERIEQLNTLSQYQKNRL